MAFHFYIKKIKNHLIKFFNLILFMEIKKISDLNAGDKGVFVEGTIIKVEDPREITTKFGRTKVMNASISDDTDRIVLTLWGEDCDKIQEGEKIRIENGFVKLWNNEKQLSVGKFGKIKKIKEE